MTGKKGEHFLQSEGVFADSPGRHGNSNHHTGMAYPEIQNRLPDILHKRFSSLIELNPLFASVAYRVGFDWCVFSNGTPEYTIPLFSAQYCVREDGDLRISFFVKTMNSVSLSSDVFKAGADILALAVQQSFLEVALAESLRESRDSRALMRKMNSELSLAEERERKKIASDLHDHIGQALAMLKFGLAELKGNTVFCGFETHIEEMETLLGQTIQYTRGLTFTISQPLLFEIGLSAAIQWLAEDYAKRRKLPVTVEVSDDGAVIPEHVKILIYKIAGELLANGAKHAEATVVSLLLQIRASSLTLDYTDNGRGFDPDRATREMADRNSWGLFSVRERVRFLGGAVKISSAPGSGTHIFFHIPLSSTDDGGGNDS